MPLEIAGVKEVVSSKVVSQTDKIENVVHENFENNFSSRECVTKIENVETNFSSREISNKFGNLENDFSPHETVNSTPKLERDPESNLSGDLGNQSIDSNKLIFRVRGCINTPLINVYENCLAGTCNCIHLIGGRSTSLMPCRFAPFLSGQSNVLTQDPEMAQFIWEGVVNGFKIVDENCETEYFCKNYKSILENDFYKEMCDLVTQETQAGLVTQVENKPKCVHSLGGVEKSNGKLRPITDCSMPVGLAINNFMQQTYKPFSYKSVSTAVEILDQGNFMSLIDLKSAYRTVNVFGPYCTFQGFRWQVGKRSNFFENNRLSFGLRCAPYIFNQISEFIVQVANGG